MYDDRENPPGPGEEDTSLELRAFAEALEPAALEALGTDSEVALLGSIAVSVARIADAQPTMRDRFAMAALTALSDQDGLDGVEVEFIAARAWRIADAMMKGRPD